MRYVLFFIFLFVPTVSVSAHETFQWKNLRFNTTSVQDTINTLGKPKKDKVEKAKFDKSIPTDVRSQMNFRKLQYQNIDDFKEVYLLFISKKLIGIELTPKKNKLFAADLGKTYNSEFLFMEGLPKEIKFSDFEGQKETTVPKVYPQNYFMLSVKPDCAIVATIDNNTWQAFWRDSLKKPTTEMFPGFVKSIQIITRSLESK